MYHGACNLCPPCTECPSLGSRRGQTVEAFAIDNALRMPYRTFRDLRAAVAQILLMSPKIWSEQQSLKKFSGHLSRNKSFCQLPTRLVNVLAGLQSGLGATMREQILNVFLDDYGLSACLLLTTLSVASRENERHDAKHQKDINGNSTIAVCPKYVGGDKTEVPAQPQRSNLKNAQQVNIQRSCS